MEWIRSQEAALGDCTDTPRDNGVNHTGTEVDQSHLVKRSTKIVHKITTSTHRFL